MPKIAIIGAGASGTLLTLRLLRDLKISAEIVLIDRKGAHGRGLAYGAQDPCLILNVPAGKMGAYAEEPGHFYEWMQRRAAHWRALHPAFEKAAFGAEDFVPRMIYGAYLQDLLAEASRELSEAAPGRGRPTLHFMEDQVLQIAPVTGSRSLRLNFESAPPQAFDAVVLASGNSKPRLACPSASRVFASPCSPAFLNHDWQNAKHLIVLGTGLSMIDALRVVQAHGFRGTVSAISRRGLIPFAHASAKTSGNAAAPVYDWAGANTALQILRRIRTYLREAQREGRPWQGVIDSMRPVSQALWQGLSEPEQKKLWRALPWWNVTRHRIPAFVYAEMQVLCAQGALQIDKAAIRSAKQDGEIVTVELADGRTLRGDALVHCMGYDYSASHAQRLCPDITLPRHWSGGLAGKDNGFSLSASQNLFALGPLLFGAQIESTAVHEIRHQAQALSAIMTRILHQPSERAE